MNFSRFIEFSKLLTTFQKVERVPHVPGMDRLENDAEHSYRLALMAWYVISTEKLDLNLERVLLLALAHDLVEVYAGDTYIFSKDAAHLASKVEREEKAATQLAHEFPAFADLHESLHAYVARETREARFVYALDKVLPLLTNYEDNGRGWLEHGVTLQMALDNKSPKVALSSEIEPYYLELLTILKERKDELFAPE